MLTGSFLTSIKLEVSHFLTDPFRQHVPRIRGITEKGTADYWLRNVIRGRYLGMGRIVNGREAGNKKLELGAGKGFKMWLEQQARMMNLAAAFYLAGWLKRKRWILKML